MAPTAFFNPSDDGRLHPTKYSHSLWAPNTLHGPAVCGVAARRAESEFGRDGFRPARFTVDLFKAARTDPTDTVGRVIRDGGRIRVVEIDVVQYPANSPDPVTVARSTTVFVRESANPPGERWQRPALQVSGPEVAADDLISYFSRADDVDPVWSHDMSPMQAPVRKRLWTAGVPIVAGEALSPFERAVIAAESTSLVGNWGDTGIGFINCDLTVVLARLPREGRVVVETDSHVESDGISTSTANLYDADGQFGTGAVVGVNNAAAEIDFTTVDTRERYAEG
ncbi:acyl-CoA thioesterase domain-containing protein [Gordonia sp. CPCC 205333]|uniref:acyl-CoA thioesterase domain-containing protein n=1 Tax=Gordonia sp. CPCC 205333 TaxID=3140790 RepID=UPI003AF3D2F7